MDTSGDDTKTLGQWLEERKDELRMSWAEVGERAGGMSRQALLDIRNGVTSPRSQTKRKLEDAVRWEPLSIDAIQRGREPTRLSGSAGPAVRPDVPSSTGVIAEIVAASEEELDRMQRLFERYRPGEGATFRAWANGVRTAHAEGAGILPHGPTESEAG